MVNKFHQKNRNIKCYIANIQDVNTQGSVKMRFEQDLKAVQRGL